MVHERAACSVLVLLLLLLLHKVTQNVWSSPVYNKCCLHSRFVQLAMSG